MAKRPRQLTRGASGRRGCLSFELPLKPLLPESRTPLRRRDALRRAAQEQRGVLDNEWPVHRKLTGWVPLPACPAVPAHGWTSQPWHPTSLVARPGCDRFLRPKRHESNGAGQFAARNRYPGKDQRLELQSGGGTSLSVAKGVGEPQTCHCLTAIGSAEQAGMAGSRQAVPCALRSGRATLATNRRNPGQTVGGQTKFLENC